MRRLAGIACLIIASFALATAWAGQAQAQKRVALVIGNSGYQHTQKLTNPSNDATDIAAALKKLGFQVVEGFDLDKAGFDRKVHDFATALRGAEAAVLFYAGHGLQVSGRNYLVPINAKAEAEELLDLEMVRVDVVQRAMEVTSRTNVLFLDACRDNPLARNLARSMGTRSSAVGSGLATIESGVGTLISFSTHPGAVASDGAGRNSPYAGALVRHIASASDDLSTILISVRNDVMRETRDRQVPWEHSALRGRFYFNPAAQTVDPAKVAPARVSEAAEAWDRTKETTSVAVLEAFIARYKETFYAELARVRIEDLKKQQAAATKETKPEPAQKSLLDQAVGIVLPSQSKTEEPKRADADPARKKAEDAARVKSDAERQRLAMLQLEEERRRAEFEARMKDTVASGPMKPGTAFRDCPECPEMVVVPAGEFMMGSPASEEGRSADEGPQRKVTIAKPFAVGKFEITFAEWAACVAGGGCASNQNPSESGWGRGKRPVINVSWDDTAQYVSWLSKKTGKTYRLLTEAEWEYAARGVTRASASHTPFSTGATISADQANYDGNSAYGSGKKGGYRQKTVEVGSFPGNAFGLHDMHGNVWEWVQDCYKDSYTGAPADGSAVASTDCGVRVLRDGSWYLSPLFLRSAARLRVHPDSRVSDMGFRVARTL